MQREMIEWIMNWKGFERKRSWSNRDVILVFTWWGWITQRKTSGLPVSCRDSNRAYPEYNYRALLLDQPVGVAFSFKHNFNVHVPKYENTLEHGNWRFSLLNVDAKRERGAGGGWGGVCTYVFLLTTVATVFLRYFTVPLGNRWKCVRDLTSFLLAISGIAFFHFLDNHWNSVFTLFLLAIAGVMCVYCFSWQSLEQYDIRDVKSLQFYSINNRVGTSPNGASGDEKFRRSPFRYIYKTFSNLPHNTTKFSHPVIKTVIGIVNLKRVVFTLSPIIFKLLSINGHDMKKGSTRINVHL
jgi:hypothetical protein